MTTALSRLPLLEEVSDMISPTMKRANPHKYATLAAAMSGDPMTAAQPAEPVSGILPANGMATPDSISRRRKLAEAMMSQGMDTGPVGSWTQGAARLAQALVGGMQMNKAEQAEQAGTKSAQERLMAAMNGGNDQAVMAAMNDPWQSQAGMNMLQDQWSNAHDPMKKLQQQKSELELQYLQHPDQKPTSAEDKLQLDLMRAQLEKAQRPDYQSVGKDSSLYDPSTKQWITPPQQDPSTAGLFGGTSVEGQALNYLVQNNILTAEQAAQVAAGKSITGADGSARFLTPSDIVKAAQATQGQNGAPPQAGISLGPGKKTESEIKGDARLSGVESSIQTLTAGATDKNPMPGFDALGETLNTLGNSAWGGRSVMSAEGQKAADATRNIIQNYIYTLSGAQAPDSEVERQMRMVVPSITDSAQTVQAKKLRLMDMINTIKVSAQGRDGAMPVPHGAPTDLKAKYGLE